MNLEQIKQLVCNVNGWNVNNINYSLKQTDFNTVASLTLLPKVANKCYYIISGHFEESATAEILFYLDTKELFHIKQNSLVDVHEIVCDRVIATAGAPAGVVVYYEFNNS